MPKIKNWSKQRDSKRVMKWTYDGPKRSFVEVRKKAGSWVVYTDRGTASTASRRGIYKSKDEAREWAVDWMKNHPER